MFRVRDRAILENTQFCTVISLNGIFIRIATNNEYSQQVVKERIRHPTKLERLLHEVGND